MADDTLWVNKTSDDDGAIMNVDGDVYYVSTEKIQKWLDDEIEHGLPFDKISDEDKDE